MLPNEKYTGLAVSTHVAHMFPQLAYLKAFPTEEQNDKLTLNAIGFMVSHDHSSEPFTWLDGGRSVICIILKLIGWGWIRAAMEQRLFNPFSHVYISHIVKNLCFLVIATLNVEAFTLAMEYPHGSFLHATLHFPCIFPYCTTEDFFLKKANNCCFYFLWAQLGGLDWKRRKGWVATDPLAG